MSTTAQAQGEQKKITIYVRKTEDGKDNEAVTKPWFDFKCDLPDSYHNCRAKVAQEADNEAGAGVYKPRSVSLYQRGPNKTVGEVIEEDDYTSFTGRAIYAYVPPPLATEPKSSVEVGFGRLSLDTSKEKTLYATMVTRENIALMETMRRNMNQTFVAMKEKVPFALTLTKQCEILGVPKELDLENKFVWTSQVDTLWKELVTKEHKSNVVKGQILAGPSGIGKSHMAFLLTARAFAESRPLLYIADAGDFYSDCISQATTNNSPVVRELFLRIRALFIRINMDVLRKEEIDALTGWNELWGLLHEKKAIVVIDEHGHAYSMLTREDKNVDAEFPFLMPNCYNSRRDVSFVFAGSNQAEFEAKLNGTYKHLLRFTQPLLRDEAEILSDIFRASTSMEKLAKFTNFVPREMRKFIESFQEDAEKYVHEQIGDMINKLKVVIPIETEAEGLKHMLRALFQSSQFVLESAKICFLDLGFVYRTVVPRGTIARPLCLPASRALFNLYITRFGGDVVAKLCANVAADPGKHGNDFEELVWMHLLTSISKKVELKMELLDGQFERDVVLESDEFFVSQLTDPNNSQKEDWVNELKSLTGRGKNIVYKCPGGASSFDFVVFPADAKLDTLVVQSSVSDYTKHDYADFKFLSSTFGNYQLLYTTCYAALQSAASLALPQRVSFQCVRYKNKL